MSVPCPFVKLEPSCALDGSFFVLFHYLSPLAYLSIHRPNLFSLISYKFLPIINTKTNKSFKIGVDDMFKKTKRKATVHSLTLKRLKEELIEGLSNSDDLTIKIMHLQGKKFYLLFFRKHKQ
ncbi:hypothetical protein [Bacillus coahuilensis]|uniref:hypothetical protein n=1 Tax=Bacillus coahuilensis TaxID=408580 RepID=UPI0001850D4B|nr:hypothetical protein [Bacillus coahuilensis]